MASCPSPFLPTESPATSSCVCTTPVAIPTLKRGLSQGLEPPPLKRKRNHATCATQTTIPDASNDNIRLNRKCRLPLLDIADVHRAMRRPAQDGDGIPKISLRPRTNSFEPREDIAQQLVHEPPKISGSLVPTLLAQDCKPQNQSDLNEPVVEVATSNQITRRSSFSSLTNGTPMMRRSLSFRLSIGNCNSTSNTGCQGILSTPANAADVRSLPLTKSLEKLSIPSLEDDVNPLPYEDENSKPRELLAVAHPPQAKRGGYVVFDYLSTALRLPDVAFGI